MLAAGQRDGTIIIVAAILLLLALVAVFFWVQQSRPEPTRHPVTPTRTEWRAPSALLGWQYDLPG